MKNTDQTWNPTELLYLFVDGEADDLQKATLFAALANDAELQAELADAIRINAAARQEQNQTAPPAAVTAALFERAGIAGPIAAASLADANAAAPPRRRRRGAALLPLAGLRRIAVPLLAGCVGALIAIALLPERTMIEGSRYADDRTAANGSAADATTRRAEGATSGIATPPVANLDASRHVTARDARRGMTQQSNVSLRRTTTSGRGAQTPERSASAAMVNADNVNASTLPAESAHQAVDRRVVLRPIPVGVTPLIEADQRAPRGDTPADLGPIAAHRRSIFAVDGSMPSLAVQMQAIAAVDLFPQSSVERADNTPLENLSFMGLYHLSDNHSIGGVFGRENHAIAFAEPESGGGRSVIPVINGAGADQNPDFEAIPNVSNNGAGTGSIVRIQGRNTTTGTPVTADEATDPKAAPVADRLQTTAEWVGVSYQFRAGALDRRGTVRPFAQAVVGGTLAGDPLGKATLGLLWKPSRRVSVGAGIEGSALVYRQKGEWGSSRKIGATYGVQIEF